MAAWEAKGAVRARDAKLLAGHRGWRNARRLDPRKGYPGIRYALLHTFAHLLVVANGKPQGHARAAGTDGPVTMLTFRAPAAEVEAYASMGAPYFYAGWGRDVVGLVLDDDTDWDEVEELVTDSYRELAPRTLFSRLDASTGA